MLIPFATSSKASERGFSGEKLINYILRPEKGVSDAWLIAASGLNPLIRTFGQVRALIVHQNRIYGVSNSQLWVYRNGVHEVIGNVKDDRNVVMATNGQQIAITSGGNYYVYEQGTVAQYTTGAISDPVGVTHLDGYFVVIGSNGKRKDALTVSSLDNGKTFDGFDFAFAENTPDELKGVLSDHGELWLFGSDSIEIFHNSGAADFPFQRSAGALIEKGCLSAVTLAKEDNAVFWIGHDKVVYRSGGSTPEVISTRAIEDELGSSEILSCFTFTDRGHKFYAIGRKGGTTLCYDITTNLWCERSKGVNHGSCPATCSVSNNGFSYVGTKDGYLSRLDQGLYTSNKDVFVSEARSAPIINTGRPFKVSRVFISIKSGDKKFARNPRIMLQTSKDGHTWSIEKWRELGKLGEYFSSASWHGLGAFTRFQVRLRITDPQPRDIFGVHYE